MPYPPTPLPTRKTGVRRGAEQGLLMGVWLSVTYVVAASTLWVNALSLLAFAMMSAVPLIVYFMLRRTYVKDLGCTLFSELWMQGIMVFIGGSIIMASVSYIYMKWLVPDYIHQLLEQCVNVLLSAGKADTAAAVQQVIDQGGMLTPADIAIEFVWVGIFTGSMLSMVVAWVVRLTCHIKK